MSVDASRLCSAKFRRAGGATFFGSFPAASPRHETNNFKDEIQAIFMEINDFKDSLDKIELQSILSEINLS